MAVPFHDLANPDHLQTLLEFAGNAAPTRVAQALLRFTPAQCLAVLLAPYDSDSLRYRLLLGVRGFSTIVRYRALSNSLYRVGLLVLSYDIV